MFPPPTHSHSPSHPLEVRSSLLSSDSTRLPILSAVMDSFLSEQVHVFLGGIRIDWKATEWAWVLILN